MSEQQQTQTQTQTTAVKPPADPHATTSKKDEVSRRKSKGQLEAQWQRLCDIATD